MSNEQEQEKAVEWPAVKLARSGAGHLYLPAPSMRVRGESETYLPESAVQGLVVAAQELLDDLRNSGRWGPACAKLEAALPPTPAAAAVNQDG